MARVTPPLNAKGLFTVAEPFQSLVLPSVSYTVTAVRSFTEIRQRGSDPLELIYTPVGLTRTAYDEDLRNECLVVTLQSESGKPIYIPDSYTTSYPNQGYVKYSHLVVSASLGALPDNFDTTLLKQVVGSVISDYIGVVPTVNVGKAGLSATLTDTQHQINETARQAAIQNRQTDRARAIAAEALVQQLQVKVQALQARIDQLSAP